MSACAWLSDLAALASIDTLTELVVDGTPVTDLSPVAGLSQLGWLSIGNSEKVFDLTPLAGLTELKGLWIVDSAPGLDLTPLHGKRVTVYLPQSVELADTALPDGVRIKRR